MRTYFSLTGLGLVVATLCGAALSWDGSVYLFQILDRQAPFVPNNRLVNIPLHWPVLLASRFTDDITILQAVFGLVYAAIPFAALAISWWIVRTDARSLFVWPALSIGVGLLPGQFFFVSEANIAVQLFWPIVFAILTEMRWYHAPIVALLAVAIFFSHPVATPLFAFAAFLALVIGLRHKHARRKMWLWAFGFTLVTVAVTLRFLQLRSNYESDQMSWEVLRWTFDVSMAGVPIKALACAGLVAAVVSGVPFARQRLPRTFFLPLYAVELISLVLAAVLLILWALHPQLWRWGGKFVFWVPFISLCFMSIAAFESLLRHQDRLERETNDWRHRLRIVQVVAGVFALVLSAQSLAWVRLSDHLRQTMAQRPWGCVSMAPLAWLSGTALNHFATPYHSILLQGRRPQQVILSGDECGQQVFTHGVWLDQYTERSWKRGWFDLQGLGRRLVTEQERPSGCSFMLTSGWHMTEGNDRYWWRWSDGRDAQIQTFTDKDIDVVFRGAIASYRRPNNIDILLNGEKAATVTVTWDGMNAFQPIELKLRAGKNLIELISRNLPIEHGQRSLAIDVGGLTLMPVDPLLSCQLRQ